MYLSNIMNINSKNN